MEIGAVFPHNEIGTDPGAIRAFLEGIEGLGLSHVLIYDHVMGADRNRPGGFDGPYDKDVAFHEPLTLFGFAAAVTTRLELVTAVLILPQRQTVLVAKQCAEVAVLSGDRLRLGIGTGWNAIEYEALSENFHNRGRREAEQVELLRQLWSEDSLTYRGEFHTVEGASIKPRPSRPIPIWFGGGAPALLRRCAELGDGWMPVTGPNDQTAQALETIRSHREAAGLPWEGFGIQAQAQYAGGDPDRWLRHAGRWRDLGATHIALATQNAGPTDAEGHLKRIAEYRDAVAALQ